MYNNYFNPMDILYISMTLNTGFILTSLFKGIISPICYLQKEVRNLFVFFLTIIRSMCKNDYKDFSQEKNN